MKFSVTFLLYAGITASLFFPFGQQTKFLIPYLLILLLFLSFSSVRLRFRDFFRIETLYTCLLSWFVLPFLVFNLTFPLDEFHRLGLFLAIVAPPAISSPVIIQLIKGDVSLGLANSILFSLFCPFSISLLLNFYFQQSDFELPVMKILQLLFTMLFIPIILVKLLERFFPFLLNKIAHASKNITPYLFILITSLGVAAAQDYIINQSLYTLLLILSTAFILAVINYGIGFFFSKKEIKRAMIVTQGYKSISLLIGVGILYFDDSVLMVIVFYLIAQQFINGILIAAFK